MSTVQDNLSFDLKALGRISNLINSTLDIPKLLEIIMDAAKDLLDAEASSLLLIDNNKRVLNFVVVAGDKGELIREIAVPIGVGIAGIVAETGEALIVNDAENDQRVYKEVDQKTNTITRNLICVPMRVKDKIVGVLETINSVGQPQFDENQLNVLSYLADQAAIALNNGDLFKGLAKARFTLQKRVNELSILFEFNDIVNFAISIQELIPVSVAFIRKAFDANSALFYLFSPARQELVLNYLQGTQASSSQQHIPLSQDLKTYLAGHRKPIQIKTDLPQELSGFSELNLNVPLLIVPLFTEGNLFGLMFLWNKRDSKVFSPFHMRLMGHLASHFSQAYANLKLHESLLVQTEIKQELKVARLIQQKILPSTFNTPDDVEIQGVSIPAEEVGGDFYDFIPIDDHKFALVIADVSGKGIPASLFMALARNTIRTEAHRDPNPKRVITNANKLLTKDSESGMFVTGAYFLVDTFNQTITYISAGHNNQLLSRAVEKKVDIIKGYGRPLGIMEDTEFEEKIIFYDKDDTLVLFTDGIVEAEKADGEQYEEERTMDFIEKNSHLPVRELLAAFKEEVTQFTEGNPFIDDFTLLITRL